MTKANRFRLFKYLLSQSSLLLTKVDLLWVIIPVLIKLIPISLINIVVVVSSCNLSLPITFLYVLPSLIIQAAFMGVLIDTSWVLVSLLSLADGLTIQPPVQFTIIEVFLGDSLAIRACLRTLYIRFTDHLALTTLLPTTLTSHHTVMDYILVKEKENYDLRISLSRYLCHRNLWRDDEERLIDPTSPRSGCSCFASFDLENRLHWIIIAFRNHHHYSIFIN